MTEQAIEAAYHAVDRQQLKRLLLVDVRCSARHCLLLHVWQSPLGLCFYKPQYKKSPARNLATSNEAARASSKTLDGDRHWRGYAGLLDQVRHVPEHRMPLDCDHLSSWMTTADIIAAADHARPGSPEVMRIDPSELPAHLG